MVEELYIFLSASSDLTETEVVLLYPTLWSEGRWSEEDS